MRHWHKCPECGNGFNCHIPFCAPLVDETGEIRLVIELAHCDDCIAILPFYAETRRKCEQFNAWAEQESERRAYPTGKPVLTRIDTTWIPEAIQLLETLEPEIAQIRARVC